MPNKFGAKTCTIEGHTFDSKFEGEIYRVLRRYFTESDITLQPKVPLIPPVSGGSTGGTVHKVDFHVESIDLYVEAKGSPTREYLLIAKILQAHHPEIWKKYVVVQSKPGPLCRGIYSIGVGDLELALRIAMTNHLNKKGGSQDVPTR